MPQTLKIAPKLHLPHSIGVAKSSLNLVEKSGGATDFKSPAISRKNIDLDPFILGKLPFFTSTKSTICPSILGRLSSLSGGESCAF